MSADGSGGGNGDEPPTERGLFVVFEGGEGAGKSTQVRLLRAAVERLGRDVVVTREPGGTPTGETIRDVLLDAGGAVTPRAEALLYAAARAEHAADVLTPALEDGAVVLCDRYVDSSIVYQGVGRGLGAEIVADLNLWATDGLEPDLTVLLDVPAEIGLDRARDVEGPDRLEAAGLEFHERVNEAFRQRARRTPDRYLVLDATEPVEDLQAAVRARVTHLLGHDTDAGHDSDPDPDEGRPADEHRAAPDADPGGPSDAEPGGTSDAEPGGTSDVESSSGPTPSAEPLFDDVPAAPSTTPLEPRVAPTTTSDGSRAVPGWLALPDEETDTTAEERQ